MNWTNRRISKTNRWISSVNSKLKLKDDWLTKQLFIRLGGSEHRESYLNLKHFFLLVRRGNRRAISFQANAWFWFVRPILRPIRSSCCFVILPVCNHWRCSVFYVQSLSHMIQFEIPTLPEIEDSRFADQCSLFNWFTPVCLKKLRYIFQASIIQLINSCLQKEIHVIFRF